MAASLSRLHHISLHVTNVDKIAYELVSKFKFNLFVARLTEKSKQLAFRKGAAVFVVNERPLNGVTLSSKRGISPSESEPGWTNNIQTGIKNDKDPKCLYDVNPHYSVDTASNVCFEVEDVERSFKSLRNLGCDFLVPPTEVCDEKGIVTYSVVKSIMGNVNHTLIDTSKYKGSFLPGFQDVENGTPLSNSTESSCPVIHFDHITYACPRRCTPQVMSWYERHFGFHRFFINSNEDVDEGYVLNTEGIGLRLTAMEYWKCSQTGIKLPFTDDQQPDCKFVIAESLPDQGSNQVDTFLEQHGGPGIQHIGLYTQDIVSTAQTMGQAGVHFFSPPPAYYTEVGKQQEMEDAGYDPQMLSQHSILLDTDLCQVQTDPSCQTTDTQKKRYLLQAFTQPIFSEDTFFLELIERRGASGFGEGNIQALWRSVQAYMDTERAETEAQGENTTHRT
ncbi:4-hydroxyphenylpyruvate dioxygenase-like protein isoform X1 [Oncorhynchus mykiss]|uniref:4-hydroxyphenylpyruvate dioxygenase n=1 Tax=Oncorhynchus mykiss TaxID=8022 RepID=A0A8K9XE47_ONCMY|nr:4-hydroxyphenylpyruvate dioxygenase-like protein isoform X1 [Oncorhynchus mykiss]XP_036828514.1 4-hydroxyphenylpyruvate dioxygenase-like protein isoform X1 [Oncorhynchus mykiss]